MRRKIIAISMLLIMLVILACGCTYGSYSTMNSTENNTANSMQMSYEKFSGNRNRDIKLDEDQTCEVFVDIVSESGNLGLSIIDKDGNSYYRGTELPTSSFSVSLDKAGKYTIRVEGQSHSGSYEISWEIE